MRNIVVTSKIKQILIFDHYDEEFWNLILESFKEDLNNGNFFKFHEKDFCDSDDLHKFARRQWWGEFSVLVDYPKILRSQCIELIKETHTEPLNLNAICNECKTRNKITSFKELNLLCKYCYAGLHPYDGVFGNKLEEFIYDLNEKIYDEHFLETSKEIYKTHLQPKSKTHLQAKCRLYDAAYLEEINIKDEKLLYELNLILPSFEQVWAGLDISKLDLKETNEMRLQYKSFLADLENNLIINHSIFSKQNLDITLKNKFAYLNAFINGSIDRNDPDWEQQYYEFLGKRKDFFSSQKINFKRDKSFLYICWELTDEIVGVKLNQENLTEMIQHFINDWHSG